MNSGIKNKYLKNTWTIFAIFALLLFLLERFFWPVGLYFDDFGNASLSYGSDYGFDVDVLGMNWGLADLLRWDKWIYCADQYSIFLLKLDMAPTCLWHFRP